MSGEITLRGKVLPVGGIKEKILAAKRSKVKEVILCEENRKDVEKINQDYLKGLSFHYVSTMQEVIDLTAGALFDGDTPVLVVPDKGDPMPRPKTVVIAWNQSRESLVAARRAMPFLRRADMVQIVVIDPPAHGSAPSHPGGLLCQLLVRHGVHAEVSVLAKTLPRVSEVLARQVLDVDADLLIMGAYGHSRFREAILGGATRDMLEHAEVPVFLAH